MSAPRAPRRERLATLNNNNRSRLSSTPPISKRGQANSCGCDNPHHRNMPDGVIVCDNCGTEIAGATQIVGELTFGETSTGAAVVQGGYIGEGQTHAAGTMPQTLAQRLGIRAESHSAPLTHGKNEVNRITNTLRISDTSIRQDADKTYQLAYANGFVRGRLIPHVAAACLYIACRRKRRNTVLLMDIAEAIQVSVFKLGEIFRDLLKTIYNSDEKVAKIIPVPEVEPLIQKFTRKLEFGDYEYRVAEDALRILRRMNRDWMVTGRQPAGLCGACIILAARMNNFRRSVREVVYIVKVADTTIHQRLEEFKRLKSSQYNVEYFRSTAWLEKGQHDPPAIYKAQEREAKRRKLLSREDDNDEYIIDSDGESTVQFRESSIVPTTLQELRRDSEGFAIPNPPIDPQLTQGSHSAKPRRGRPPKQGSKTPPKKAGRGTKRKREPKPEPPPLTEADVVVEAELEQEITEVLEEKVVQDLFDDLFNQSKTKARFLAEQHQNRSRVSDREEIDEDEFDDDPEIASCLLSEAEIAVKEKIWVTHNEDWLRQQQAKILKKTLDEASGVKKKKRPTKKKADAQGSKAGVTPASSPAEAARQMAEKRAGIGFSTKINYEKFQRIYKVRAEGTRGLSKNQTSGGNSAVHSPISPQDSEEERADAPSRATVGLPTPAATQRTAAVQPSTSASSQQQEVTVIESDVEESEDDLEELDDDERIRRTVKNYGIDMGVDGDEVYDDYGGDYTEEYE
ncbi:hypothetical protein M501DRAFT_963886 [Patellaria atrata CBS 101060]|uniref:Cyclin-like domain-containing protein n=1 Tax=Patellaria atrata CBS 101060 TaxID=1346257 RepID=A0A9P4VJ46_9PEZI|nr:hypothetical protein M501DRAFT_963886 [Patellaria atrata CBS 101060]